MITIACLAVIAWPGVQFCIIVYSKKRLYETATPKEPATLRAVLADHPKIKRAAMLSLHGQVYLEIGSDNPYSKRALASGVPVYIFDESGDLLVWTVDSGDDPGYQARRRTFVELRRLSADEIDALTKSGEFPR